MITEKDLNILDLLSQGYNQSEISVKLKISLSNVEKSIKSSKTFLGAKTLFHLGVIYCAIYGNLKLTKNKKNSRKKSL